MIRLLAAAVWLVAGGSKIADLEHFRAQVHAYKLLPAALEAPFAYALPFVEVGVGAYLTLGLLVRGAAAGITTSRAGSIRAGDERG